MDLTPSGFLCAHISYLWLHSISMQHDHDIIRGTSLYWTLWGGGTTIITDTTITVHWLTSLHLSRGVTGADQDVYGEGG